MVIEKPSVMFCLHCAYTIREGDHVVVVKDGFVHASHYQAYIDEKEGSWSDSSRAGGHHGGGGIQVEAVNIKELTDMMMTMVVEMELKKAPYRFHRQNRAEKTRRIRFVERLCVELHKAKGESCFSTAYAEDVIG